MCLFCFLTTCTSRGLTLRVLSHPSLAALGPATYAAYLIQMWWINLLSMLQWHVNAPTTSVVAITAALLSGAAIHKYVEKPIAPLLKERCVCSCAGAEGEA